MSCLSTQSLFPQVSLTLSLSLALLASSFLLFFSISFSRVICKIMEVTKYDRVLAQCDRPANIQALHKDHQERSTKMGEHEKATGMDA
jgi:hypothetical protein